MGLNVVDPPWEHAQGVEVGRENVLGDIKMYVFFFFYNWPLLHYYKGATNPLSIFSVFVLAFCSVFFHLQHVSVALFVLHFDMRSFLKLWHFSPNGNVFALKILVGSADSCTFCSCNKHTFIYSVKLIRFEITWCIAWVTRACQEFGSHITLMHV